MSSQNVNAEIEAHDRQFLNSLFGMPDISYGELMRGVASKVEDMKSGRCSSEPLTREQIADMRRG